MPDFLLPDLGEGLTDAEIVTWLVSVGDQVAIDQPVVEVETAKASVEVPVPFAGKVSRLFGRPGDRIPVGSPLIAVEEISVAQAGAHPWTDELPESSEYSGNVLIGYGTSSPARRRDRSRRSSASPASADLAMEAGLPPTTRGANTVQPDGVLGNGHSQTSGRHLVATSVISPVVRKLARDRGIDLATVRPSDPSGVIRRCDIEAIQTGAARPRPEAAAPPVPAGVERVPLVGLRKAMADKLSLSRRVIPEATVWVDVDATGLLDARRALNAARPGEPVSVLALVSRFCVLGLRRFRELNSRITDDAIEIFADINLGFAAQTPRGLMVPVVAGAQALTTRQLSAALTARTESARGGSLTPTELTGGTFTVNNYGVFGVDGSAAIINHPEVAILGIGRIIDRPWVHDGQLSVRKVSQLTLAFDHRACDGGIAGGFLRLVADCVENPVTALGEL